MKNNEFWSWLAGFWEGEGCLWFSYSRSRVSFESALNITQKSREPLDYIFRKTKVGFVRETYNKGRLYHVWNVRKKKDIIYIVERMLPYIIFRYKDLKKKLKLLKERQKIYESNLWSFKQEKFIRDNYKKMYDFEIGNIIGRNAKAVEAKRERMGLLKKRGRRCR